jgi:pimeloyl-ACP methyl ester carboxylesterase
MSTVIVTSETARQPKGKQRNRGWLFKAKRGLIWFGTGSLALCVLGATYQTIATEADQRNFPAPGQMVDVGGYRLHLLVTGRNTDAPTVILEAGTLAFSPYWAWVQPEIAGFTRVVAYDRAGLGWSDPGPGPRDAEHIAAELHTALHNAGILGPYILVAHSQGGLYAPVFAHLYPDEVAGLVLVEPQHPSAFEGSPEAQKMKQGSQFIGRYGPWLARLGLSRFMGSLFLKEADGTPLALPPEQLAELAALIPTVQMATANSGEVAAWEALTFPQVRAVKSLGDIPLVVLSGSQSFGDSWVAAQAEYAALSTNSLHHIVVGATHGSLLTTQEGAAVVVEAVRRVIESARTGKLLVSR